MITPCPKPIKKKKDKPKWTKKACDSDLSKMIDRCDTLCRSIVKMRAGYKCEAIDANGVRCNKAPVSHHHIVKRTKSLITRILSRNGIALCDLCHDHTNEAEMDFKITNAIGEDVWDVLHIKAQTTFGDYGVSKQEYVEIQFEVLKKEFKALT